MSSSIVDNIVQSMSSGLISRLSTTTGESSSSIGNGLSAAIRAVTAGMATRADDSSAMEQIHKMAVDPANDLSLPERADDLFTRVIGGGSDASSNFLQSLLMGSRFSNITDSLAGFAGVSKATARSLFGIAMPLVVSYLGKMIRTDRLDARGLSSRLAGERDSIVGGLPPALSGFFPSVEKAAAAAVQAPVAAAAAVKRRSAMSWVVPAALAALCLWAFASFFGQSTTPKVARDMKVPGAVGTSGVIVRHELPGNVRLAFRPDGTEARLLAYIKGSGSAIKEDWFEFDRLNFETDSAVLKSDSRAQIANIAAILKAYPSATVKIGGYTDNSGDSATNMRLSQMRAEAVRDQLREMGIDASRVTAEGYGDTHPVADNSTDEGRAKNRRVAIRVTAK